MSPKEFVDMSIRQDSKIINARRIRPTGPRVSKKHRAIGWIT